MTLDKQYPIQIKHQDLALDAYLDSLLEGVGLDSQSQSKSIPESDAQQNFSHADLRAVKPLQETGKEFKHHHVFPEDAVAIETAKSLVVMPEWTHSEFQALFFKIGKIVLAVPLTDLVRTIKLLNIEITRIPGQATWFLGLIEDQGQQIGVLDTGQLVLGKTQDQQRDLSMNPFNSLLITGEGNWGLACDEVISIAKLTPDKVRWRSQHHTRPWLIGTIIDELTAIVDVRHLVPQRKT